MTTTARSGRLRSALIGGLVLASVALTTAASSAISVDLIPVKADNAISERHPSAEADWLGWTSNNEERPNRPNAFVQQEGNEKRRLNPPGTFGEAGGFDGSTFVWTQWNSRRAGDIWRIDLVTRDKVKFGGKVNTDYGEFYPTLSGDYLLFTRFDWDANRYRVILFNRVTGIATQLASGPPSRPVFSGQVNGNYVTYTRAGADASNAYRYEIDTQTTLKLPNSAVHAYGPAVAADGTVFYIRSGNGCARNVDFLRLPLGGTVEKIRDLPAGYDADRTYVDDRADETREVHFQRVDCDRSAARAWDTFKFVDSYTLTVTKDGAGTGTVTSEPAGINCGSDCTEVFPRGALSVTLTAVPDPGFVVAGWNIPECGANAQCVIDIKGNQTVTATFEAE